MANEQNLRAFDTNSAREAQRKSAASRKRNNSLRKLGLQMLQSPINTSGMSKSQSDALLRDLKAKGFDTDRPELQMQLLANLFNMAADSNWKAAIPAMQLLMEITGTDARTQSAEEQARIDWAKVELEQKRFDALHTEANAEALEKLDDLIAGIDQLAEDHHAADS